MTKINPDDPASPFAYVDFDSMGNQKVVQQFCGLTKREEFAKAAMQGILSDSAIWIKELAILEGQKPVGSTFAKIAVEMAGTLISELNKENVSQQINDILYPQEK